MSYGCVFEGCIGLPLLRYTRHVVRCHPIQGQPKVWKMHFCRYGPFEFDLGHSRPGPKKTGRGKIPCENTTAFLGANFHRFTYCFAIWLIRGFRRYGWKLFAAYPDLFSRCFHLGMDLWKSHCTSWICCSVSTESLLLGSKRSCIYCIFFYCLFIFLFTDTHIYIYYAYIGSDLGGQTVGPLLTFASSFEWWFVSYTLSQEVSSKVVWKKEPKEFFYDLLVDKEILPAETLAQMQETFFRVEKVALFDGLLTCFCTTNMN